MNRIIHIIKDAIPRATKTAIWVIKITVGVSFAVIILEHFGVIDIISLCLAPIFRYFGLPGEAALAFISGFFVNVYVAIAVIANLNLDFRAVTILGVMILCAHNMFTECAIQKKTGTPFVRMFMVRFISAFTLAFLLNLFLPMKATVTPDEMLFVDLLRTWCLSTLKLVIKMLVLIFSLNILQRVLKEYGIIQWLCDRLEPVMIFFGLPANTAFLWIVANTLGLAYGSSVILDELQLNHVSHEEADLLNHHIGIAHSNLEDVILLASVGAGVIWMLFSRWIMAFFLVRERKLELKVIH